MALTYSQATFSNKEKLTHTKLNAYFSDIRSKFNTDGITDGDIANNAAIAGSKLDLTATTGRITQVGSLSADSTPSLTVVNTGNGGAVKITNSGTGPDIFINDDSFIIDIDNDNDSSNAKFSITKDGGTTTIWEVDETGAQTFIAQTKYITIQPSDFIGEVGTNIASSDMFLGDDGEFLRNHSATGAKEYVAPVSLPNGAVVSQIDSYYIKAVSTSVVHSINFIEKTLLNATITSNALATAGATATSDVQVLTLTTISNATIDNTTRAYTLVAHIDPGASVLDIKYIGTRITYTLSSF